MNTQANTHKDRDASDILSQQEFEREVESMYAAGERCARNRASWMFDGNTSDKTRAAWRKGLADGDPMYLDQLPSFSFGEHSGESENEVIGMETCINPDTCSIEERDELCEAFLDGFGNTIEDAVAKELG